MIVRNGYVVRKKYNRNWFLIKHSGNKTGYLAIRSISFPEKYVGKKIMLKVEVKE